MSTKSTAWPSEWRCKVIALDPSKGTESKFGDDSAFVLLMIGRDGVGYVDADLAVRNTSVIAETALEHQRGFRPDWFGVEANQFQELLAEEMWWLSRERNVPLPLMKINNYVNKVVRIRRLTPLLAKGVLRFKGGSPGARRLVQQLRDFPHGDHDDGPDALEMAVRLAGELLSGRHRDPDDLVEYVYT